MEGRYVTFAFLRSRWAGAHPPRFLLTGSATCDRTHQHFRDINGTAKVDPHLLFSYEKRGFYDNCPHTHARTLVARTSLSNRPGAGSSRALVSRRDPGPGPLCSLSPSPPLPSSRRQHRPSLAPRAPVSRA